MEIIKTWKIFILRHSILFWHKPFFDLCQNFDPCQLYGPTPPTLKFRPMPSTSFFWLKPKFYGPTPPMPKFQPTPLMPFLWTMQKFYRPMPLTPKFHPSHPWTHVPMHPCYSCHPWTHATHVIYQTHIIGTLIILKNN